MRLVVSNGSKRLERNHGTEWIASKVEDAGNLQSGVYKLYEARPAVTTNPKIQYAGTVLYADDKHVYQQLGRDNIARHEKRSLNQVLDVGQRVTLQYEGGKANVLDRNEPAKSLDRGR